MFLRYSETRTDYKDCKTEQAFKMKWLKCACNSDDFHSFCIETEETVKGFPDVMTIDRGNHTVSFMEFKYSTKAGVIKFQPTQPAFYKKYKDLEIFVVAYNAKTGKVHVFTVNELFSDTSPYRLSVKAEINLTKAEERIV